jgi:hypothetical protein
MNMRKLNTIVCCIAVSFVMLIACSRRDNIIILKQDTAKYKADSVSVVEGESVALVPDGTKTKFRDSLTRSLANYGFMAGKDLQIKYKFIQYDSKKNLLGIEVQFIDQGEKELAKIVLNTTANGAADEISRFAKNNYR